MKRLIWITLILFLVITNAYTQSEYRYFQIRFGLSHNLLSPKPENAQWKFLNTPEGEFILLPNSHEYVSGTSLFVDYSAGFTGDILYHFDFKEDHLGIAFGIQYATNSITAKYVARPGTREQIENPELIPAQLQDLYEGSTNSSYWVVERNRMYSVGIPVMLKFGKNIYTNQQYWFVGGQFNYNLSLVQTQKVGWSTQRYKLKVKEGIKNFNAQFFLGFNYSIFNFEFGYMPGSFFEKGYKNENGVKPYADQPNNLLSFKTCITIPLSEWLVLKSWQAEKIRRKFKFAE